MDWETSRICSRSPRQGSGGVNCFQVLTSSRVAKGMRWITHASSCTTCGSGAEKDLSGADAGTGPRIASFPDAPPAGARRQACRFWEALAAEKL